MAEVGTKRQRLEETTSLKPSERTEGLARRPSGGLGRSSQGYSPSMFSITPGEFFTMSPITLMRRFTDDIDRVVSGFGGHQRVDGFAGDFTWLPAVEVRRSGNNLIIRADLPGLSEKDVKVEATDEGLLIEGERNQENSSEEGGVHFSERAYGHFSRLILLPEGAKVDEAKASFKNGVLEINIPVPESETKRRQIAIGSSGQVQAKAAAAGR
jgi:HSP20 family protein